MYFTVAKAFEAASESRRQLLEKFSIKVENSLQKLYFTSKY